ncbi:MAG: hypothetical protein A4E53_02068 [Pelotomaculum sp. PtaB.Bin104]|nr:MAG: hypothetical protein A4E53_02068 [Pelotomaculum sp. PtaB.Bin104]
MTSAQLRDFRTEAALHLNTLRDQLNGLSFTPDFSGLDELVQSCKSFITEQQAIQYEIEACELAVIKLDQESGKVLAQEVSVAQDNMVAEIQHRIKVTAGKLSKAKPCSPEQTALLMELSRLKEMVING